MTELKEKLDINASHKHFAVTCFNGTWELMEALGDEPTTTEADALVLCAGAALWHWTQRDDVTDKNLSIGAWLMARVYAVVRRDEEARYWAARSLEHAEAAGADPFYVGYAYEAMARACLLTDLAQAKSALEKANGCAQDVQDEGHRSQLKGDLQEIAAGLGTRGAV